MKIQATRWDDMPKEELMPGLTRQMIWGEKGMAARILLKKGVVVPQHTHESEQITMIQEGALHFTFPDGELTVRAGESIVIPSMFPHGAVALEDTVDWDVFAPPRQDWIQKTDAYLRGGEKK